jgi:hypothetical protein
MMTWLAKPLSVLELAFKKQIETNGFPDFTAIRCQVVSQKELQGDLVELVEECAFPDGGQSRQILHACKNSGGWHIVILPSSR